MNARGRAGAAVRHAVALLVPAGRRDWIAAVWAEAPETPPGLRRLAWRAGGLRVIAREAVRRSGFRCALAFGLAAALAIWAAWPDSPASFATSVDRADLTATVAMLAGLALLVRRVSGPAVRSRVGRLLRVAAYAAILALIPAKNVVEQVLDVPPRGTLDLRLYRLIAGPGFGNHWGSEIVFLVLIAFDAAAILWLTSERARVSQATLVTGAIAGATLGLAWYVIGPLGFGGAPATNPWLAGRSLVPFLVLAVALLIGAPVTAMIAAGRRPAVAGARGPARRLRIRQVVAASLLTSITGGLVVTVLASGTIAATLRASWLRSWMYGRHPLSGVAGLRLVFGQNQAALDYSHQITAAMDAPPLLILCLLFLLVALVLGGLAACGIELSGLPGRSSPPSDGGGGPGPEPAPRPPGTLAGVQLAGVQLAGRR